MDLTSTPWLASAWQSLADRAAVDRMPHAVLIHGQAGVRKRQLAMAVAKLLLCQSTGPASCGECPPCLWFAAGSHPDFLQISPQEDSRLIRVDQIRALSRAMSLTASSDAGYRVAVLQPADRMNVAAGNALLKTLEEPPGRACLLLVADTLHTMPATVLSRCQRVVVETPPRDQAKAWLQQLRGSDADSPDLDHALFLAAGSPGQAATLLEHDATTAFAELLDGLSRLRTGRAEVTRVAQELSKVPMQWTLSWMLLILKQCLNHIVGASQTHPIPQALAQFSHANTLESRKLNEMIDQVLRTARVTSTSLRPELLIEDLLCDWSG